ncbi:TPM domain-containing protein [Flagellimonas zhangzhouensis]|uniref:TLP18.3, Psb32 and MOLO-1 founding protein of phosphatase n=1 Tax=Flagellimonas zhangzhouensis TaxID=1073328 RepID=A0A1H2VV30_9FLAO|nr:TPM domain-containing protein [Allomuricauda zhangzhouensis]SDQ05433.1 TLP18.3, Psb32 and MOLO-1 founding protein of phosphatase [Allomuricauda zhangzhouensis]SDW72190.1 TLP18.3, Psb32 and MOLO-1 founding protein of phosphatase [Allomuricauda zhangzhouensis]
MSHVEEFLTAEEEKEIINAIVEAEKNTSGEIRVHIEAKAKIDHFSRAQQIFHFLKMDNTKEGNGVLIYVAVDDHKFVIYGDSGIDRAVPKGFWDTTKDVMQSHFKKGHFKQGIVEGILVAGKELEAHFPWDHNDTNELNNAISKG